jgi:hypothetical protein
VSQPKAICIAGIDPGKTGALAFYFPDAPDRVAVFDMPIVAGEIDGAQLADHLKRFSPDAVVVESIHFMPKSSRASAFAMGEGFGAIKGVIAALAIPVFYARTTVWKKHFRLPIGQAMSETEKHEESRKLALQVFPHSASHFSKKKDHGRAEAALLARYGAEVAARGVIPVYAARELEAS